MHHYPDGLKIFDLEGCGLASKSMAVLTTGDNGWIISHETFINNIYKKTNYLNDSKSFYLNPALFDIKVPFVKKKCNVENHENGASNVDVVKKAYEGLFSLYEGLCLHPSDSEPCSNRTAKSLANDFYSELTKHPDCNFLGGNSSSEPLVSEIGKELYLIPEKSFFYCYDVGNISEHLGGKEFDFILMDPPWWNKYIRRKRKKNSKFGYDMVYDKDLANIPINFLLSENGMVAVWCTSAPSHINSVLHELFPAWELQYVTQWFWLKITKFGKPICEFSQSFKKQPFERLIFGVKNSNRPLLNPESDKIIMSVPSAIHSHKPPLCDLLKPYLPEEPKCLELFARYLLPKWTSYGNEVLKLQHISLYSEKTVKGNNASAARVLGVVVCAFGLIFPEAVAMDSLCTMSPFGYWMPQRCMQCRRFRFPAAWSGMSRVGIPPNHLQSHRWEGHRMPAKPASDEWKVAESVYDFTVNDIHGNPVSLSKYKGHVLLIVNVASRCGLTANNYKELVELHDRYHDTKGLRILAFPCNQFGGQEPGTNEEIVCFARGKNARFDFFDKIKVNGEDAHPLWKYLKKEQGGTFGDLIKWNFTKFIVDKTGKVVERHGPSTDPLKLISSLEKYF